MVGKSFKASLAALEIDQPMRLDTKMVATKLVATNSVVTNPVVTAPMQPRGEGCFTKLPHSVSRCLEGHDFTSREIRVILTVLRETLGWNQEFAAISNSTLAERTRIALPHIPAVLRKLENEGAIIRQRQANRGKNLYALNAAFFRGFETSSVATDLVATNLVATNVVTTEVVPEVATKLVASGSYQTSSYDEIGNKNKNKCLADDFRGLKKGIKENLKNSLSGELEEYFSKLTNKKRISEEESLNELLESFSMEDIGKAFLWLKNNGEPRTRAPVHSPMSFLAVTMPEILAMLAKENEKQAVRVEQEKLQAAADKKLLEQRSLEAHKEETAIAAFIEKFPTAEEQQMAIEKIWSEDKFYRLMPKEVARRQAILAWKNGQTHQRLKASELRHEP